MPKSDKYICTPKIIAFSATLMLFVCAFASFIAYLGPHTVEVAVTNTNYIDTHASFNADSEANSTILNAVNSPTWGAIPGPYQSVAVDKVGIQNYPHATVQSLTSNFSLGDAFWNYVDVKVLRENLNPQYEETSFDYTPKDIYEIFEYGDPSYWTTVNYAGISLYSQMMNQQDYMQAWQGATFVFNKMYEQSFLFFYYSLNSFDNYYQNYAEVSTTVYSQLNIEATQYETLYNDPQFGMNSIKTMTWWVQASIEWADGVGAGPVYHAIVDHFALRQIDLSEEDMVTLIGPDANVTMQISTLNENFTASFGESLNSQNAAIIQWATSSLLNNPDFLLDNVTTYGSMNDLGMDFLAAPELANSDSGLVLTQELAESLFGPYDENSTIEAPTLLNPDNMYQFYFNYNFDQDAIVTDTGLSLEQIEPMHKYLNYLGAQMGVSVYGTTIAKSADWGMHLLRVHLPLELATRSLALFNSLEGLDCGSYMRVAEIEQSSIDTACANYNFTNVTELKTFVNATWYNDFSSLEPLTGLTTKQVQAFYNPTTNASFQNVLDQIDQSNAEFFGCTQNTTNCTAEELAAKQWGSYSITNNPHKREEPEFYYMPACTTLFGWTDNFPIPGVTEPLEYAYYTQSAFWTSHDTDRYGTPPMLNTTQVLNMTDSSYSWYGLTNVYNNMLLTHQLYFSSNLTEFNAAAAQFGLNQAELAAVVHVFDYVSANFLFQGPTATYDTVSLLLGFNSPMFDRVNTGTVQHGNIYYNSSVTPCYLYQNNYEDEFLHRFSVLTGQDQDTYKTQQEISGTYLKQNGQTFQNNLYPLYNGKTWSMKSYFNQAIGQPQQFESYASKPPAQVMPADTTAVFYGWDTRFPDVQGQYNLTQMEGPTYCIQENIYNGTCTATKNSSIFYTPDFQGMNVDGQDGWKLPYRGTYSNGITADVDSGYTLATERNLTWWLAKAETPYPQLQQTVTGNFIEAFQVKTSVNVTNVQFISTVYPVNGADSYTTTTIEYQDKYQTAACWVTIVLAVLMLAVSVATFVSYKRDQRKEVQEQDEGLLEAEVEDRDLNQL